MKNSQNQKYIEQLVQFGIKPQEAVIFLACLALGEASVGQLAKETGIQRTFVYDVVADLVDKGIFSQTEMEGVKKYSSITIDQFKQKQLDKFKEFETIVPEIRALQSSKGDQPKVKFFVGKEGLRAAYQDILDSVSNTEILAYASAEGFYEEEPEFQLDYVQKRVKQKISARSIAVDTPEARKYTDKNKEQLRTTRLVPAELFPFSNEIDIYANKVAIMSVAQNEYLAVIIESESISKTQRAIFELAWRGAKDFQK